MTMRSAASLALIGAVLVTILLVVAFVLDLLNVLGGLVPALRLVTSFIYALAAVGGVVFLWVCENAQSWGRALALGPAGLAAGQALEALIRLHLVSRATIRRK